jgi:uncharacterized membrane protein YbhN (UPF0104 family)
VAERDWRRTVIRGIGLAIGLGSVGFVALVIYAGGFGRVATAARQIAPSYVASAVGLLGVAWLADALRYRVMSRPLGVSQPVRTWLAIALINQFGAYAVSAGAPAAGYALARRGVDGGTSFALALAKQSLFVPAVLGPVFVLLLVEPSLAGGPGFRATLWIIGGIGIATLVGVVLVAAWPAAASRVLAYAPVPEASRTSFVDAISKVFRAPRSLIAALALALINQAALAAIVVILLSGAGSAVDGSTWARALVFSALSQAAPTPAGAGITEVAGTWLFAPLAALPVVTAVVLAWRFLALQVPIVVGGVLLARAARRGAL